MPPKKDKKEKIKLSLYINKTPYKFGCNCTFCNKVTATLHCAECPDFFCAECDVTAHSTKKRATHVRQKLSKLDLKKAAGLCTRYVRLVQHLNMCKKRARAIYRRYFDLKTLCHYYYNAKWGYVTWRKPFCLRLEELCPFFTPDTGASKIQCLYHLWKSRIKVNERMKEYYIKVFSRDRGRFYYCWLGKSALLPKSSWKQPFLLGRRGYPYEIKPVFTKDAACVLIQRRWRTILVRRMMHALVRGAYDQIWDPVSGSFTYYHRETEILYKSKPRLLGNQPWDPNFIPMWDTDDVYLFLRRIGLKIYADNLYMYGIDGKALLLLDNEDFDNLDIFNRIHRKKIKAEVFKRYPFEFRERASEEQTRRREAIRKLKLFTMASKAIQSVFRGYLARKEVWLRKEMVRLAAFEAEATKEVNASGIWWSYRDNIPSLELTPFNATEIMHKKITGLTSKQMLEQEKKEVSELDDDGNPIIKKRGVIDVLKHGDSASFRLPVIQMKSFGRRRDHKSVQGWGRKDVIGWGDRNVNTRHREEVFEPLDLSPYIDHRGKGAENFQGTDNPTRSYSARLVAKGYDRRRFKQHMRSLGVTEFEPSPEEIKAAKELAAKLAADKVRRAESDDDEDLPDDTFAAEDEAKEKVKDKANAAARDKKKGRG